MPEELVDVYNPDGSKTGEILTKEKAIKIGALIKACQVWIINSNNEVLMQIRSNDKIHDAGMLDLCSGHVQSGETEITAVVREIKEELGKEVFSEEEFRSMQKVGIGRVDFTKFGRMGNYIVPWYLLKLDRQIPEEVFNLQKEEVAKIKWIEYEKVKQAINEGRKEIRIPKIDSVLALLKKLDNKIYDRNFENNER